MMEIVYSHMEYMVLSEPYSKFNEKLMEHTKEGWNPVPQSLHAAWGDGHGERAGTFYPYREKFISMLLQREVPE